MTDEFSREQLEKLTEELHRLQSDVVQLKASGVRVGTILRTGVGSYDFLVSVVGEPSPVVCTLARSAQGVPFGYADCDVPREGSVVSVILDQDTNGIGYILGTLDTRAFNLDKAKAPEKRLKQLLTVFGGPNTNTESIYSDPISKNDRKSFWAGNHRPGDVFPSDFVRLNEYGVGIDGDTLTMAIRGGQAHVSASVVDNAVEIVSKNFRAYDVSGFRHTFLDGGYITTELNVAPYLGERKGGYGIKSERPDSADKDRPVGKYRFKSYLGYLGGLFSCFITRDKESDKDDSSSHRTTADTKPEDKCYMQTNINDNGRLLFRSAGGFALERSDSIAAPIRIKSYDDPEGFDAEDVDRDDVFAFPTPKDDKDKRSDHYTAIALADRMVHEYKQSYSRFLEYISSGSSNNSEFYLKEEKELDPLDDESGTSDRSVKDDDLEHHVGRKAGIYCLPNGSLILRDAWGSEIIMEGGSITINACGNININPGRSFVAMSGDDAVIKAMRSVDVEACNNDITIHADRNVRIGAGSDASDLYGSIVLETFAKTRPKQSYEKGEDFDSAGIIIKAKDSGVAILSDTATVLTKSRTNVVSNGQVAVLGDNVGVSGWSGACVAGSNSGLVCNAGTAALVGSSVTVAGESGVVFASEGQVGVPLWFDVSQDFVSTYINYIAKYTNGISNYLHKDPLKPFTTVDKYMFSFRSSGQCSTIYGTEIYDRHPYFMLYQPYWAVLLKHKIHPLYEDKSNSLPRRGRLGLDMWGYDHTVDGQYPWPGTAAIENGYYARLNTKNTGDGFSLNQTTKKKKTTRLGSTDTVDSVEVAIGKKYDDIHIDDDQKNVTHVELVALDEYDIAKLDDDVVE